MAAPYIVGTLLALPQIARILKLDPNTVLAVAALFIVVMIIHKRLYKIAPHKIVIATDCTLICFYAFGSGSDAPAWTKSWLAEFHKMMGSLVDFLITQVNWSLSALQVPGARRPGLHSPGQRAPAAGLPRACSAGDRRPPVPSVLRLGRNRHGTEDLDVSRR